MFLSSSSWVGLFFVPHPVFCWSPHLVCFCSVILGWVVVFLILGWVVFFLILGCVVSSYWVGVFSHHLLFVFFFSLKTKNIPSSSWLFFFLSLILCWVVVFLILGWVVLFPHIGLVFFLIICCLSSFFSLKTKNIPSSSWLFFFSPSSCVGLLFSSSWVGLCFSSYWVVVFFSSSWVGDTSTKKRPQFFEGCSSC